MSFKNKTFIKTNIMNAMEAKELYNCSLSSIVTSSFAVQWSHDNHLSIITEKGIHIFELVPSPMHYGSSVKFSRSFIYVSDVLPTDVFSSKMNSVIWKMKKEEVYSFILEEIFLPRVHIMTELNPRIVSVAWSPQGLLHPCRCLLGMISSAGAVDVLLKDDNEWFPACDLLSHWQRIVVQDFPEDFESASCEELKFHVRRLQAVAITWSELKTYMDKFFSYFIVAYRSSDIIVWKIPAVIDHNREVIPTVALRTNLKMNIKVDVLEWITISRNKSLLAIGLSNGQIHGLILEESQGDILSKQILIYGEEDLIKISSIKCILVSNEEIQLIISKSILLIVILIDSEGKKRYDFFYTVPAFSITGLSIINRNEFLIYTQDANLYFVKIENQELTSEIVTSDLPKSHCQFLGLANSYNKVLFATVTSPNSMFDHLVVREPSTLYIFSLEIPQFNPLEILEKNETFSMLNHWDCLEAIGMKLSKSFISPSSLKKIPNNFESLPVYKLRILMWFSILADVYEKKRSLIDISRLSEELIEIRSLISLYTASSYLISIAGKSETSPEQRLSARFLRTYLEIYLAGEIDEEETPPCRKAQGALEFSCKIERSGPELCNLCSMRIADLPWKIEKCPSGHKLPRCAVTLLQITSIRYRSCPICRQIFHSCLDEEYPEGPKCLFCDVPVLYDSRVSVSVNKERKNFSLRRASRLRTSEQEEGTEEDPDYSGRRNGYF